MVLVLFIALLSTFIYIDITITGYIDTKLHMYSTENNSKADEYRAKVRLVLSFIMAVAWSIYITFN